MSISLKELKKNRLTPAERFVLETIGGCVPETKTDEDGSVGWWKNGTFLFEQNFGDGELFVSFHIIWSVLKYKFGLNNNEIKELLTNLLHDYTDNGKLKII